MPETGSEMNKSILEISLIIVFWIGFLGVHSFASDKSSVKTSSPSRSSQLSPSSAGSDWWALQPVISSRVPEYSNSNVGHNPIDAFIAAAHKPRGLTFSPPADKRNLIRRLSFDLTGLPPLPETIDDFCRDESPDAYERLVDRLLNSPHYGERWARHWLDVVRYGESNGFERDLPRDHAWPYRNWLIGALNRDLPYDRFVSRQIAGDIQQPHSFEMAAATGFLVAGPHDTVLPNSELMKATMKQDELEDLVGSIGQTFLGMTINCARCHDHKFDPLLQKDYYRFTAAVSGVRHGEKEIGGAKVYTVKPVDPEPTHLLLRGNASSPGPVVPPGGWQVIQAIPVSFGLKADASDADRRRRLSDWITNRSNPLFARVMVNRLWHYHFGTGIVDTPNDFGFSGGRPTHPELLDWLASEFIRHQWSLKAVHRLIVTSSTYRQSSIRNKTGMQKDGDNRYLWRFPLRRLDAETLRDTLLTVAGQLDREVGGEGYRDVRSYFFKGTQFYDPLTPSDQPGHRRTLYRFSPRGGRNPFLDTFDCPDPSTMSPVRGETTTPLQALALMNNELVFLMADHWASLIKVNVGSDIRLQVEQAFKTAYGRDPDAEESSDAMGFVESLELAAFCRVIFNSNEFLMIP